MDVRTYDLIFMDQYMASAEKQVFGTDPVRVLGRRASRIRFVVFQRMI